MHVRNTKPVALLLACLASLLLVGVGVAEAQWALYEETSISGTISGSIRRGYIFKTRSGNIYEVVDYVYLYEYEYSPEVVVLSDGTLYRLIIEGFDEPLTCKCLNCSRANTGSENWPPSRERKAPALGATAPQVVESYISNEFDGLKYGNVYRLGNGQIWEQTEYWIWIWIWINPKVVIWNDGGIQKMKVEGIDHAVIVTRLK